MGILSNSKGQMKHTMQHTMTQTFNISILNNNFGVHQKSLSLNPTSRIGEARGVRSINLEAYEPFSV